MFRHNPTSDEKIELCLSARPAGFQGPTKLDGSVSSFKDVKVVNLCEKTVPLIFEVLSDICTVGTLVCLTTGTGSQLAAASLLGWTAIGFENTIQNFGAALCRLGKDDVAG